MTPTHLKSQAADHLQAGRKKEAAAALLAYCKQTPADIDALSTLGNLLRELGALDAALAILAQARARAADNPGVITNHGAALHQAGKLSDAIAAYREALRTEPTFQAARINLALALYQTGAEAARNHDLKTAVALLTESAALNPEDPHGAGLLLQGIDPEAHPTRPPAAFLAELYRRRAPLYDKPNRYRGAALVAEAARQHLAGARPAILDLGCGTGAIGELLHDITPDIDGIDISPHMIEIARRKQIYSELICAEISSFLHQPNPKKYHAITAAGTLIHFGRLDEIFRGAAQRLSPGGSFIFTSFPSDGPDYALAPLGGMAEGGLYLHNPDYIRRAAASEFEVSTSVEIHEFSGDQPRYATLVQMRRK